MNSDEAGSRSCADARGPCATGATPAIRTEGSSAGLGGADPTRSLTASHPRLSRWLTPRWQLQLSAQVSAPDLTLLARWTHVSRLYSGGGRRRLRLAQA
jgi:hypothetical protein